ncbi:MAG: class I SAM-dependent methyltransferase [Candidatus Limnocylindrales bacterium]|jgi:hypothetical protein
MEKETLAAICALPNDWHGAGTVSDAVLVAISRRCSGGLTHSVETGTGRTTLLLSHLSRDHTVFTKQDRGDGDSLDRVRASSLFVPAAVRFVEGPTQITVPRYAFSERFEFALLDGPHGFPFPYVEYCYIYPHIAPEGLLVVDDVQIPTIRVLVDILRQDPMWQLREIVGQTAFLQRTDAPTVNPLEDGWQLQGYNRPKRRLRDLLPPAVKQALRRLR